MRLDHGLLPLHRLSSPAIIVLQVLSRDGKFIVHIVQCRIATSGVEKSRILGTASIELQVRRSAAL